MSPENESESDRSHQRRQWRQRRQRKIEIRRQMKHISDEAASEEAARSSRRAESPMIGPLTEEEVERITSLEVRERDAAARRQREWGELRSEMDEINRADRIPQRRNGDSSRKRHRLVLGFSQQGPQLDMSESDSLSPGSSMTLASPGEDGLQSTGVAVNHAPGPENFSESDAVDDERSEESDEFSGFSDDDEEDVSDNTNGALPRVRWISQENLWKIVARGVTLYQSAATDAIYYLDHLGEKTWVVDKNGDCVIAQDQNLDRTIDSSQEEAVPQDMT